MTPAYFKYRPGITHHRTSGQLKFPPRRDTHKLPVLIYKSYQKPLTLRIPLSTLCVLADLDAGHDSCQRNAPLRPDSTARRR